MTLGYVLCHFFRRVGEIQVEYVIETVLPTKYIVA